jgi:hypothetical protein
MRRRTHAPVDNWLPRHDYGVHQTGTGPQLSGGYAQRPVLGRKVIQIVPKV